jgi:serine/threonine protein kinase
MLAMTLDMEAETTQPTPTGDGRSYVEWLDDLSTGECSWEMVFRGVRESLVARPDDGYELLALVDQYFRRHRISAEEFHALNVHVQALLLGSPPVTETTVRTKPVTPPGPIPPKAGAAQPQPQPQPHAQPQLKVADIGAPTKPRTLVANEVLRNRYRVLGTLAHGGMGTVYAAIDEFRLDDADGGQCVAIKVLHTEVIQRPDLLAELRGEFQRLQSLSHPNIVRVHEFDRDGDLTFFTMEHLSGSPLSRVLASNRTVPIARPYALAIIQQVGAAVDYAHARGIVHGDINPGNIFITDLGEVRVLDFGASYRLHREPTMPDLDDLSRTAVVTPSYASCDMLQGAPATVRDDIYALACVSYMLLTGRHPYHGKNALEARAARLAPRRPTGLSTRQWRALRDGLRFERERRPGDMQDWLDQWHLPAEPAPIPTLAALTTPPVHTRGPTGWLTLAMIALVAAVSWWALDNSDPVTRAAAHVWNGIMGDSGAQATANSPAPPLSTQSPVAAPPVQPPPAPQPAKVAAPKSAVPGTVVQTARKSVLPMPAPTDVRGTDALTPTSPAPHPSLARLEMGVDAVDVAPFSNVASVPVQRRDSYRSNVSFTWWTEPGTAKPGQDFVPVNSRVEYLVGGDHQAHLLVPIVADPRRHAAKNFYVVIDDPSDGAKLGTRQITLVTIPAS